MTSTDEHSFLKAIYTAPDDDTPRLVFADWLDERGSADDKARAALIRAQCRAEYLAPGSKERKQLENEAKALIKANEKLWLKDIRAVKRGANHTFRRGFLDGLTISPTDFIKYGAELFRIAPTIRTVRFPNAANELTELAESPFLARLANVDLTLMCTCGYCAIDDELRDLFKSKHAKNLRSLNVSRDRIDADVAAALAKSTNLTNLTTLDLSDNPLGTEGLGALAKSKHLTKLTTLVLSRVDLAPALHGMAGLNLFTQSKNFPALTRLELSDNALTWPSVSAVVGAPFAPQLKVLNLSKNRIGEQGAKALVGAELPNLELLDLRGIQFGPRAIKMLKAKFGKKVKL